MERTKHIRHFRDLEVYKRAFQAAKLGDVCAFVAFRSVKNSLTQRGLTQSRPGEIGSAFHWAPYNGIFAPLRQVENAKKDIVLVFKTS